MPSYVAFLRAVNVGGNRLFPKAALVAAVEGTGATDVATHLASGNVRLTSPRRSPARVAEDLEAAFAADRGFAVPTVVFTRAEVAGLVDTADRVARAHDGPDRHYLTLLRDEPTAAMRAELADLVAGVPGEHAEVHDRAVHLLLTEAAYHAATLGNARIERIFGAATTRGVTTIRAVAGKWC